MTPKNTCSTCQHWRSGFCCRFPPIALPSHLDPRRYPAAFVFPETKPEDSCGEWQWAGHNRPPQIETRDE